MTQCCIQMNALTIENHIDEPGAFIGSQCRIVIHDSVCTLLVHIAKQDDTLKIVYIILDTIEDMIEVNYTLDRVTITNPYVCHDFDIEFDQSVPLPCVKLHITDSRDAIVRYVDRYCGRDYGSEHITSAANKLKQKLEDEYPQLLSAAYETIPTLSQHDQELVQFMINELENYEDCRIFKLKFAD
jgi:hypothetical protein